jgi:hypothetical protein
MAKLECLETTVTNENCIREELENIKFGDCLLSCSSKSFVFPSASKDVKTKIYKTIL